MKSNRGFSLIELMIALVAGLLVSGAAVLFLMSSMRSNGEYVQSVRLTDFHVATIGSKFKVEIDGETVRGIPPLPPMPVWPWKLGGADGGTLHVSWTLIRALMRSGERSEAALTQLLESGDPQIREAAVRGLAGRSSFNPWPWPWPRPRPIP